jgi:hypothetical protein
MKATEFLDAVGESWVCRFNTPALLDAGRELDIKLSMLENPSDINIGIVGRLVWYSVRGLAAARGLSRQKFEEERMTLPIMPYAVRAAMAALGEAFPNDVEAEQTSGARPLEQVNGGKSDGVTSMS